uniref:Uncharacterized protein n=1 Tax=Leersia perrieri TaxID=77586 RepID=A0A0D9XL89_9ORYZ
MPPHSEQDENHEIDQGDEEVEKGMRVPALLNHGSWRMSVPRLWTMQGPGTAAPAPAAGADEDESSAAPPPLLPRICADNERRAA